jgi:hypothetical protein
MNRSSPCRHPFMTLLLLLAVYVLSFGPVKALDESQKLKGSMPSALVTCYRPVGWLYDNTPLGKPMLAYDAWWNRTLKQS